MILLSFLATPAFAIKAGVTISSTHGLPGSEIFMSGSGFAGDSIVSIAFGGANQSRAGTNAAGSFTDYVKVPTDAPGTYAVSATDGINTASANFTIDSSTVTSTSTSSSSNSTKMTTTVTTTVSTTSTTTATRTVTSTTTSTSFSTLTTSKPAVTLTATVNYTTTESPAAPVTTTTTLTQPAKAVTVTVSVSESSPSPGTAQSPPQSSSGFSDASLYFLAGVGVLATAASVGILALREKSIEDYRRGASGRESAT